MQTPKRPPGPVLEVTVERSFDLLEKSWESRIFLKLYLSLRTSGLLKAISDKDLRTLIALATFMDEEGRCFPSQSSLALALGISQAGVAKRMKGLLAFRWQGKPLVTACKVRTQDGRFENTIYTVLPASSLAIFGGGKAGHITPSHMAGGHTNQSQKDNQKSVTEGKASESFLDPLALQLAQEMGDVRSLPYYRKLVREVPASVLLRARGEVLEEKTIKRSWGAMFAHLVKKHLSR